MSGRYGWLALGAILAVVGGCTPGPTTSQSILSPGVHPYVLQSNSPSPWQVENSITIPFVGPDRTSMWTFSTIAGKTSAVRLDIPTNVVQDFPLSGTVNGGHAGPDGNFWFCGTGQIGKVTANGDITYYPEPLGGCQGMTSGPDGNIWIADPVFGSLTSTSLDRMTPDGQFLSFTIPAAVVATESRLALNIVVVFPGKR